MRQSTPALLSTAEVTVLTSIKYREQLELLKRDLAVALLTESNRSDIWCLNWIEFPSRAFQFSDLVLYYLEMPIDKTFTI